MMRKAQYFYIDYFISIFIIFISLVMFYGVISTSSGLDDGSLYELVQEGDTISNSLLTRGYPYGWDSTNVMKIGIVSESNKLDSTKVREFATLAKSDYYETKALFGSKMDYGLFFLDSINKVVNVNGVCRIGRDTIIKNEGWSSTAYYYDNEDNHYLKGNMSEYGATIFNSTGGSDVDGDWLDLIAAIDDFNILVLEDPRLETNTDFNSVAHVNAIESFVDDGGTIILTRDVDVTDFLGVHFNSGKHAGNGNLDYQFSPLKDDYLNLVDYEPPPQENIFHADRYTFSKTVDPDGYLEFARFNGVPNPPAIARWEFGDGLVYYISHVKFQSAGKETLIVPTITAVGDILGIGCGSYEASDVVVGNPAKVVRVDRYVFYDGEILKMVLYLWD